MQSKSGSYYKLIHVKRNHLSQDSAALFSYRFRQIQQHKRRKVHEVTSVVNNQANEMYVEEGVQIHACLTFALDERR
jgi:hypothetical protein